MSKEQWIEVRGTVSPETYRILDAYRRGKRIQYTFDLVRMILDNWAAEQAHLARMIVPASKGYGTSRKGPETNGSALHTLFPPGETQASLDPRLEAWEPGDPMPEWQDSMPGPEA